MKICVLIYAYGAKTEWTFGFMSKIIIFSNYHFSLIALCQILALYNSLYGLSLRSAQKI